MAEINREKVIRGLEISIISDTDAGFSTIEIPVQQAENILALLKEQEWKLIVEDSDGILHGLPGDDGTYFMTDGEDIWIDEYTDGVADGIFLDSGRDIRNIKAWMHMPKLPK